MKAVFSKPLFVLQFVAPMIFAAAPAIGIVTASGSFTVDRSQVWGNSTLFDGAVIQTGRASSELALRNGVKLQLGARSSAQVFENRMMLRKGVGQVSGGAPFFVDAAGLRISGGKLRVEVSDRIEVASLSGEAKVASRSGVLLATIPAGRGMSFGMQAATGTVTRTGCLLYKDGHFILQDENTQEVAQIDGTNLAPNTGNRVEVSGVVSTTRPAVSGATLVINAAAIKSESEGGCLSVASALDAKTEAPSTAAATPATTPPTAPVPKAGGGGMSTGAKIAIVGAVAGGGAGAALALAGKKSSTSP